MARIAVTRTIHALPGKRQQHLDFLKRSDAVRRQWGMVESLVMEKAVDPQVLVVIQIWQSDERYQAWQRSAERAAVIAEGRRLRVREPGLLYRVIEDTRA